MVERTKDQISDDLNYYGVETWTAQNEADSLRIKRNALVVEAVEAGMTLREIAELARMKHPNVNTIKARAGLLGIRPRGRRPRGSGPSDDVA